MNDLLAITLGNVIKRYESAHGVIDVGRQVGLQQTQTDAPTPEDRA